MSARKSAAIRFISFFLLISFIITCNLILFLRFLDLDEQGVRAAAPVTMANVILLSVLFTVADRLRYHYMVEMPVGRIAEAIGRAASGDFSVRISFIDMPLVSPQYKLIAQDLNRLFAELGSVETLKLDFISSVSHELKTPMSVIQNYATLLLAPSLPNEKRAEYSKSIAEQTHRMSEMVTNILRLNKLENQQIFPETKVLELSEEVCGSVLFFETLWEKKDILINTELDDTVRVSGDSEMLALVWGNLMSNAIKFTGEGGSITVRVAKSGSDAVVEFTDTGCGMTEETGRHIFQKFYQGDTSHAAQGNGLGLALVKRIIDIHGGEITVKSEPGRGSSFTVRLKAKED